MDTDIILKLKRHGGHRGWRIRPYPINPALWLAETYIWLGRGNRKGWRALRDEKRGDYRTFATPEQAYAALLAMQKELDDLERQFEQE